MNAPRRIPEAVLSQQLSASNPEVSAWVSANAGSGKTHVLTQRVVSLLLQGEDPAKILCITFTKAAAANMATRVFDTLAEWTALDDQSLDRKIRDIGGRPNADTRAHARRLFALALETPGGLKVQTIHAFCTRLLHQFPFEADVAARFTVLDDVTERQLLEELSVEILLEGAANLATALGRALESAIATAADQTLRDVIREAIAERDQVETWIESAGSVEAAIAQLSEALGIQADDSEAAICRECEIQGIPAGEWLELASLFETGRQFDVYQSARWLRAASIGWPGAIDDYLSLFLRNEDGTPKKDQYIMGRELRESNPFLWERLAAERERVTSCGARLRAVRCRDRTRALLTIAHAVLERYRAEKERRGLLDYDDLIDRALDLFHKTSAAWVLYKLDLGIDHVLLDEAQDTSPKQWAIIKALTGEFTAGAGARPGKRTIFAVGDDKQSIFSFQGAAPRLFNEMRIAFERAFTAVELTWRTVKLQTSFRSGPIVLHAVDAVFAREEAYRGLSADRVKTVHEALPDAAPGNVEIWPLILPGENRKIEGWDAPFDRTSEESPAIRLARRIARNVSLWKSAGTRPGDILILVRQRGPLFEAIIRALKQEHIAVAGADRLVLTEHIAVMDLIALADALLLPQDDLALATVLKSPLFGFDDDDLFKIAWNRGQASLRAALFGKAADQPLFAEAAFAIRELTDAARRQSPFIFYARLLGKLDGRKKFIARLGPEANDAIDEFLNLALDYESRETPSLQGFVAWLRAAQAEIKRDMEMARDEVRVMTVHGAKGLEAHTVILADTTSPPAGHHPPRLIALPMGAVDGIVWAGAKDGDSPAISAARQETIRATEDEYRRLLYVAMTRAKERLVVCGTASRVKNNGTPSLPEGCWYGLIEDALRAQSQAVDAADGDGKILRYLKSGPPEPPIHEDIRRVERVLPSWLTHDAVAEPAGAAVIAPSAPLDEEWAASSAISGADRASALARGRLTHRLMQSLPDIAPEWRAEAAQNYLARAGAGFDEAERAEIAAQVFGILDDPLFSSVFAAGSRAEVPIVGRLDRGGLATLAVSGQVDRLAVNPDSVLIADYKTNRDAPRRLEQAIADYPGYIRQLALYRALLERIYPGRAIRAALIWTEAPNLMEIPAHALDHALAPVTSA